MGEASQSASPAATARPFIPHLTVELRHRVGTLELDIKFELTRRWTVLFGPSGSGKTTLLRAICGLMKPERVSIRSRARATPFAPQSPHLFPHWDVADNLTMRRSAPHAAITEILSLFRLEELKNKRPSELSGGEAQRVNLARAATWTAQNGLLLLDEPFNGMDVALRDEIVRDMQVWLAKRDVCVLSVTHDVAEAFQQSAEVIKIAEGRVVAQGPPERVLAEERERLLKQLQI